MCYSAQIKSEYLQFVRGYDPPDSPYGSGHRGIDIATAIGTVVVAPDHGVVTFAGKVGGRLFLTIDHGGGVLSTCSWLTSVLVRKGDRVLCDTTPAFRRSARRQLRGSARLSRVAVGLRVDPAGATRGPGSASRHG